MIKLIKALCWLIPFWILASCAQVRGVSGGEKDVQAPSVVNTIPKNQSTYFNGKTITLEFDEFVQTGTLLQNLIVSPPLKKNPKISVRGKSVTLTLQEELKENTTYVFQFGEGISDIRENNLLGEFAYVVSTGAALDSLLVLGSVQDAWEGTPIKGMKAMLFDASISSDSSGVKPLYYSKTDVNGNFKIPFIKEGSYRLEVLEDGNNNMIHDEGEKVAFSNVAIPAQPEALAVPLSLNAYVPKRKLTFISDLRADSSGFFVFTWPQWCNLPDVDINSQGLTVTQTRDLFTDSVFHWINGVAPNTDIQVIVNNADMPLENDTLDVMYFSNTSHGFADLQPISKIINPTDTFALFSRYRITDVLNDNVSFWVDSLRIDPEINLNEEKNRIEINYDWEETGNYRVLFDAGSVFAEDNATCDSLFFNIQIAKKTDFGVLSVNFSRQDEVTKVFMLTDASGHTVFKQDISSIESLKINQLKPGEYTARVFEDTNGNFLWDSADYQRKTQAETLLVHPQKIQIRANWEVELTW